MLFLWSRSAGIDGERTACVQKNKFSDEIKRRKKTATTTTAITYGGC